MDPSHDTIEASEDHGNEHCNEHCNEHGNEHNNESNRRNLDGRPYPARDRFEPERFEANVARRGLHDDDITSRRMEM